MTANRFTGTPTTAGDAAVWQKVAPASNLFHAYLTDDGSDYDLNENYSSSAGTAYWTAPNDCVVQSVVMEVLEGSIAQNTVESHELFFGANAALTNGIKFRVENSSSSVLLDITNTLGIKTEADLIRTSCAFWEQYDASNGTAGNNTHYGVFWFNLQQMFGRAPTLLEGNKFIAYLNDDLSGLDRIRIHVYGYYL